MTCFVQLPIRSVILLLRICLQKPLNSIRQSSLYDGYLPIEQEYVLEELKHLPVCEIN